MWNGWSSEGGRHLGKSLCTGWEWSPKIFGVAFLQAFISSTRGVEQINKWDSRNADNQGDTTSWQFKASLQLSGKFYKRKTMWLVRSTESWSYIRSKWELPKLLDLKDIFLSLDSRQYPMTSGEKEVPRYLTNSIVDRRTLRSIRRSVGRSQNKTVKTHLE